MLKMSKQNGYNIKNGHNMANKKNKAFMTDIERHECTVEIIEKTLKVCLTVNK